MPDQWIVAPGDVGLRKNQAMRKRGYDVAPVGRAMLGEKMAFPHLDTCVGLVMGLGDGSVVGGRVSQPAKDDNQLTIGQVTDRKENNVKEITEEMQGLKGSSSIKWIAFIRDVELWKGLDLVSAIHGAPTDVCDVDVVDVDSHAIPGGVDATFDCGADGIPVVIVKTPKEETGRETGSEQATVLFERECNSIRGLNPVTLQPDTKTE